MLMVTLLPFFYTVPSTTEIYTLSLHDALPISFEKNTFDVVLCNHVLEHVKDDIRAMAEIHRVLKPNGFAILRSEEHTSELQSPCNLVCRLLLEKKNK